MKNKIFLSSMLIMSVAPAMAEPSNTGEFPTGGLMQEDYTYTNAATSTNMDGVYSGTVNAVAEYDVINYIVNAGQYLPADSETVITCPAGSFCPGIDGNVQYNQTTPQGIQTCPTGYASSAAGASSDTECYTACTLANANIAHATAVSGNDYYGSGVDTCEPTACENGWHISKNFLYSNLTLPSSAPMMVHDVRGCWGKDSNGVMLGAAGDKYGTYYPCEGSAEWENFAANTPSGTFRIRYSNLAGINEIEGYAVCNNRVGVGDGELTEDDMSLLPSGQNMWWKITKVNGKNVSSLWVGYVGASSQTECENKVTAVVGEYVRQNQYGAVGIFTFSSIYKNICEANTITINWSNADANDISANNAGTATYGSDVRTPVKAQTIKGKTFKGWRFSKPTQTTTGN